jgi:hypothetical protein
VSNSIVALQCCKAIYVSLIQQGKYCGLAVQLFIALYFKVFGSFLNSREDIQGFFTNFLTVSQMCSSSIAVKDSWVPVTALIHESQ